MPKHLEKYPKAWACLVDAAGTASLIHLRGEEIRYPLKRKNYDELILAEVFTPRILVLVTLPRDVREWLSLSPDQLILRRCSYWLSLSGLPESDNEHSVTVSVPRSNLLTVEALKGMMERINESGVL